MSAETKRRSLKAKFFRGLSDESRLSILETLQDSEKTVGQIAESTRLSQPNVSNHLSCLRRCGLVTSQQNGRTVTYKLNIAEIRTLLDITNQILDTCQREVDECETVT
jgi:DNA-binding transcriptional ArsR family regulator